MTLVATKTFMNIFMECVFKLLLDVHFLITVTKKIFMLFAYGRKKGIKLNPRTHKSPGYIREILAVAVAVAIIAVVLMIYSYDYTPQSCPSNDSEATVKLETCVTMNPGATEQGCLDSEYQRKAIKNNDPEICKMIKSETLRHHCLRYFGLVR